MKKENYLSEILKNDMQDLIPDPAIEKRLEYILLMKRNERQIYGNSFLSLLTGFFSLNNIGIKAGIISAMLVFTIMLNKIPENRTVHVNMNTLLADSSCCNSITGSFCDTVDVAD